MKGMLERFPQYDEKYLNFGNQVELGSNLDSVSY